MRNEVLRDVLAGCAGVLAVAAAIGLPSGPDGAQPPARFPTQHAVLLPHFSKVPPNFPKGPPSVPVAPRPKITTGP
jgi:hypothetical protein